MRYIDRTGCQGAFEKAKTDKDIKSMGKLTRRAAEIAEKNGLGLLRTHWGIYRIIRESGFGAFQEDFKDLAEVDEFLLNLPGRSYKMSKTWLGF